MEILEDEDDMPKAYWMNNAIDNQMNDCTDDKMTANLHNRMKEWFHT